ncbi:MULTISPECIES: AraC family transcriptional regulator [Lacrimispora]|jgi:AraC-like DNA-binding protein/mannose-6-phosphate isomerase-like protein (cupin superfamily)|uniref:Alfa-amylase n=1 Tax=Lacrimispora algidixylanolytica TaxID=94868 RepID=A0A419TC31_9FIRM|nr:MULTISPECIES: AraC family transcriptional regulator [Lacrimispora]RKD35005.1 alfa-amylase [Lacrimispora algidixylanolytica]
MRTGFKDLNIKTTINDTTFLVLNIAFERFLRSMPKHSHGNNSYELHYIPYGHGKVSIDDQIYNITPNTLYMTGPHVEHEQIPVKNDPMTEYCIYFKIQKNSSHPPLDVDTVAYKFEKTHFWFGQDTQELYPLMQQIFFELEHRFTGYMIQVEALLQQCLVKIVRNYENRTQSKSHFSPSNLVDSKYIIVEECFLYEYETITLEIISERLGLSIRQTERFLKEYYGKTFLQKKTEAKMSMAKIYLNDDTINISEIADRLNYSSIQHFSYAFKQYYGITPTNYRKNSRV